VRVERYILGELQTNCWVVGDDADGPLIVIDPAGDADRLLDALGDREVSLVVLTHAHFDHLAATDAVLDAAGARLAVHEADAARITSPAAAGTGAELFGFSVTSRPADLLLRDGDIVKAGDLALEVLYTPGHTKGGICLYGDGHLFSGDTLFAGSVGRSDFPGGDARELRDSIYTKLAPLPDDTRVHPGHGPDTTIGRERQVNPFFPRA